MTNPSQTKELIKGLEEAAVIAKQVFESLASDRALNEYARASSGAAEVERNIRRRIAEYEQTLDSRPE